MRSLNLVLSVLTIGLLSVACSSGDDSKGGSPDLRPAEVLPRRDAVRPNINQERFDTILRGDADSLAQMGLAGRLGNCRVVKISDSGCGPRLLRSPLYQIRLQRENVVFPEMGSGTCAREYCLDEAGMALKSALREGFCFAQSKSLRKVTDQGLVRKAFMKELGQCTLVKVAERGCGLRNEFPLFSIRFAGSGTMRTSVTGRPATYCFEGSAGFDLRSLVNSGACEIN